MSVEKGKLFVGGFTNEFTEEELTEIFSEFGKVLECVIYRKRMTFAHIIYENKASCQLAVNKYEMKEMKGITMRVGEMKMTKEKEEVKDERTFGDIELSVVLVRPMHEHNIGAVGRLCANYGVKHLYVVNPLCELGDEAVKVSRHGNTYIQQARVCQTLEEVKKDINLLIGFTARESSGQRNKRMLMKMQETGDMLETMKGSVGLVFGNESNGLNTEECDGCDVLNKIDIQTHYPILNLSHAVGIALNYMHCRLRDGGESVPEMCKEKVAEEKEALLDTWKSMMLAAMNEQRETGAVDAMRKLLGRVMLTEREAQILERSFKGILHALQQNKEQQKDDQQE